MNIKINKILEFLRIKYLYFDRTKAFNNLYKQVKNELFINTLDKNVIKTYQEKWSAFKVRVELDTFILCYNLSGKIDYNIVPENIYAALIESKLNPYRELQFFDVKNIYEKWFSFENTFPKTYFHKIDNIYYDSKMHLILNIKTFLKKSDITFPMILKPSKDSQGGAGVEKVNSFSELLEKMENGKHLVFQELIMQNEYLNSIYPGINSIRTCLYRTKTGEFTVLNNSIRFGVNGGLDNVTSGGIACNIHETGRLNDYAISRYVKKYFEHPNSQIPFKDITIPYYEELNKKAILIANQIPLCNLLSLDMCLDHNDNWRCIEINTKGQTIRFAQHAGKGFFGEYTDEVISIAKQ